MARLVVVIVCLAGLGLGALIARPGIGLARQERVPFDSGLNALQRALRALAVTISAGIVIGALVGGLGGRLFMRIMAATSGESAQGAITDAGEVVGDVSFAGTFALIFFGGVFGGVAAALIHRTLRRWLPAPGWLAGLCSAFITLGVLGAVSDLINPDNRDFDMLSPRWLAIAMIVTMVAVFGVCLGATYERFDRSIKPLRRSWSSLVYVPILLISLAGTTAVVMLLVCGVSFFGWRMMNSLAQSNRATRIGQVTVGAIGVVTVGFAATNAFAILTLN